MNRPGEAAGRGARLAERFYRVLLHMYPRSFRLEFEPALVEAFHARRRAARSRLGARGAAAFWLYIFRDLLISVPGSRHAGSGVGTTGDSSGDLRGRRGGGDRLGKRGGWSNALAALSADLRNALRRLRRQPGFSAVTIFIIALGISGATAVFSVVNGVLLRSLPYDEPERIVRLWANLEEEGIADFSFTKIEFRHFFDNNRVFEAIGGDFPTVRTITGDGDPERVRADFVTPGYFETFGVRPALGRFVDFDDIDGGDLDIVVISHSFWQRRLGSDLDIIGRTLLLNDRSIRVIGVLPADYRHLDDDYEVFVPYTRGTRGWIARWLGLSARLAPGVTIEQAQANVDSMMATLAEDQVRSNGWTVAIEPVGEWAIGRTRGSLLAILGAVALVLLLACANVANLLLARATTRRRETAVRLAIGASRGQIVRQHLVEGLIIATAGGIAGIVLAYGGLPALLRLGAHALPRLTEVAIDTRVLGVAVLLSLCSGTLFGMAPAWYAYRAAARHSFAPQSAAVVGRRGAHRLLTSLIVAEVALALAVLVGAGLFLRSFQQLQAVDVGIDADRVLTASISLPGSRYGEPALVNAFYDELLARVAGIPGVERTSITAYLPLDGEGAITSFTNAERLQRGVHERVATLQRVVRKDFFRTLGIPLLRGRNFDESGDLATARQLIISQSLAEMFWPGEDPVGKCITSTTETQDEDWREIIGVVGDVRYVDLESELQPQIYESHFENPWRDGVLVTRTAMDPSFYAAELRRVVAELDTQVPVADFRSMNEIARESIAGPRFSLLVFAAFALTALILACAGIYGVVSFVVGQRTREIGVRMALGATHRSIVSHTLARSMFPVLVGIGIGVLLSIGFSGVLASVLFGISPLDPMTYAATASLLAAVALLACWLPSSRAATIDPMIAMRED